MTKKIKCTCHPDSPFLWKKQNRPSIFQKNKQFSVSHANSTMAASKRLDEARLEGKEHAMIKGISRNREQEILRIRNFTTYLRAVAK